MLLLTAQSKILLISSPYICIQKSCAFLATTSHWPHLTLFCPAGQTGTARYMSAGWMGDSRSVCGLDLVGMQGWLSRALSGNGGGKEMGDVRPLSRYAGDWFWSRCIAGGGSSSALIWMCGGDREQPGPIGPCGRSDREGGNLPHIPLCAGWGGDRWGAACQFWVAGFFFPIREDPLYIL